MNYYFLGYLDMSIIWIFCIFQMFYNFLVLIKIRQAKNKLTWYKLSIAYGYWTYPIIYSIFPMIKSFQNDFDFGMLMVYLRIPPITITAILIITWTIYIFVHNSKTNTKENIKNSVFIYDDSNFKVINESNYYFRKMIVKTNYKYEKKINEAKDERELIKVVEDIQGWFISKDKFSWMWLNKKEQTQKFYIQIFQNICCKTKQKLNY